MNTIKKVVSFKPIKICSENTQKIRGTIIAAQSSAKVRLISEQDVFHAVNHLNEKLGAFMYKKDFVGLRFSIDENYQKFAGAYRGSPESTHFIIEYKKSGPFLTNVVRTYTRQTYCLPLQNMDNKIKEITSFLAEAKNWN